MRRVLSAVVVLTSAVVFTTFAPAEEVGAAGNLKVDGAVERTPEQMDAFDATVAVPAARQVPFRPTVSESAYRQMKQAAEMAAHNARPKDQALSPLVPVIKKQFAGATECDGPGGCGAPPDVAGVIGTSQFVSVSNNVFEVRNRLGTLLKTNSLNGLCGYSAQAEFDPRVLYDEEWQRWVITAVAFPNSPTDQEFCLAISKTNSATGAFAVYVFNVNFIVGTNGFYDFPMLGMQQDYLIFTANAFGASTFLGSSLFAIPKALAYNGFGFSVPWTEGLAATLQPARTIGLDTNPAAWLAEASYGTMQMYQFFPATFTINGPFSISGVTAWSVPAAAPETAACGGLLDTLDGRFPNVGIQYGSTYYQTHTTNDRGVATPRYYIINLGTLAATQANFFASATSYDFNPSISAQPNGRFALGWSATDPPAGVDNSQWYTNSATGTLRLAVGACYGSAGVVNRWGDYSSTSADPGTQSRSSFNTNLFWIDNELGVNTGIWTTHIGELK